MPIPTGVPVVRVVDDSPTPSEGPVDTEAGEGELLVLRLEKVVYSAEGQIFYFKRV